MRPDVLPLFDEETFTASYIVVDPATGAAALIDSVLDYDPKSGRTSTTSADRMVALVRERELRVEWILETHVHADHLSAAHYLSRQVGGRIAIGEGIRKVQRGFSDLFNVEPSFKQDGSQFDHLFTDGDEFTIGSLKARVIHTPGHTPADITYVVGDAAFVGDTLFQPDYGTARCDFPGGDARSLYRSIRRILDLPPETRLFTGHDYKAPGRDIFAWESTVADQRAGNIHVRDGVSEEEFAHMRQQRDGTLSMPRLILPALQVNMRAGDLPPSEPNGRRYLKIPLDAI